MPDASLTVEQKALSREFTFPGDLASVAAAREAVMDFLRGHCSSEAEEIDLFLTLQEALANAALHGCGDDAAKFIHCSVQIDPSAFTFVIRDAGDGFDVHSATHPTQAGINISERGRGICLMRSLMDEVSYQNGGSELRLRKLRRTLQSAREFKDCV